MNKVEVWQYFDSFGGGTVIGALIVWVGNIIAKRILLRKRYSNERLLELHKRDLNLLFNSQNRISEAEFNIYRHLWIEVAKLKHISLQIRSGLEKSQLTATELNERYRFFQEALFNFELQFHSDKPFYAPEVFEAIQEFANAVSRENKMAIAAQEFDGIDLARSRMDGIVPILEASEIVCESIRQRIYLQAQEKITS